MLVACGYWYIFSISAWSTVDVDIESASSEDVAATIEDAEPSESVPEGISDVPVEEVASTESVDSDVVPVDIDELESVTVGTSVEVVLALSVADESMSASVVVAEPDAEEVAELEEAVELDIEVSSESPPGAKAVVSEESLTASIAGSAGVKTMVTF